MNKFLQFFLPQSRHMLEPNQNKIVKFILAIFLDFYSQHMKRVPVVLFLGVLTGLG